MLYTKELENKLNDLLKQVDFKALDSWNTFKVIATSDNVDRDGDILTLDGWDVANYLKNPVILANHEYEIEKIIWKATKIYQEGKNIIVEWVFSQVSEMWKLANALYNEGMLKAVSVWFIQKEREEEKVTIKELLELSFVAVPANPRAISLDWKTFEQWVQKGLIKQVVDVSFEKQLRTLIKEENPNSDVYVNEIFTDYFVFSMWKRDIWEKYYKRWYLNTLWTLSLDWENIEVASQRIWVEKKEFSEIKSELADLKSLLIKFTNDKVDEAQLEKEKQEALEKKEVLQNIDRAIGEALKNMKSLK